LGSKSAHRCEPGRAAQGAVWEAPHPRGVFSVQSCRLQLITCSRGLTNLPGPMSLREDESVCPTPPVLGSEKALFGSWVPSAHQVHSPAGLLGVLLLLSLLGCFFSLFVVFLSLSESLLSPSTAKYNLVSIPHSNTLTHSSVFSSFDFRCRSHFHAPTHALSFTPSPCWMCDNSTQCYTKDVEHPSQCPMIRASTSSSSPPQLSLPASTPLFC
jgi:hypothetical protein